MSLKYWSDKVNNDFEESYLALREKEKRMFSDEQVRKLPFLENHPLEKEWQLRQKSTKKLLKTVQKTGLKYWWEIGCGNGWFSNQLSKLPNIKALGTDVNETELKQAARLFSSSDLCFAYCQKAEDFPKEIVVDGIIFNACIQYFSEPQLFITSCRKHFPNARVFILDSPIYKNEESAQLAAKRTQDYYQEMGHPELTSFYHHHTWKSFNQVKIISKPSKIASLIGFAVNPFPVFELE